MAQRAEKADWTDRERIRQRAVAAARLFVSPAAPEKERPFSPELVARVTEGAETAAPAPEDDPNAERIHRPTERSRINRAPETAYPG